MSDKSVPRRERVNESAGESAGAGGGASGSRGRRRGGAKRRGGSSGGHSRGAEHRGGRRRSGGGRGPHPVPELFDALTDMLLADQVQLRRRVNGLRTVSAAKLPGAVAAVEAAIKNAQSAFARRAEVRPEVVLAPDLPITSAADEIVAAIREHQVVVIAGETGSGKTTQLPKLCLQAGRGVSGLIGHTQPRRIAARSVATRIASEMGVELGEQVGYSVRFTDTTSEATHIRLMTDGILLAEISRDRLLSRYDTIIVDEAHERSLNIDFLLGYLHRLLPKRPDLKVIITSATIDVERFADHFRGAPVIEVSGRTYPVDVWYRPLVDVADPQSQDVDQVTGIVTAVAELTRQGPGDILVFLSGEREIRDAADALVGASAQFRGPRPDVVPLYARLSSADQNKIFTAHSGRRIVLSTNVAETSLTVPGIKYVVDVGTARISRYSHRLKVQRLPIEPVSQASANQRAGRCGRVSEGICVRLYSEEDYQSRPEYTEPEILRTNLASVMLSMISLGLGAVEDFPFIQPPDRRHIKDGVAMLTELQAIDENQRLTRVGRSMAALPIDPRIARMIIAATDLGNAPDVLTIAAALSIQDPRERPTEFTAQADQSHARFKEPKSDFLTLLNLWDYLKEKQKELSSSAFRRMCKAEFLHYVRIREWQDVRGQLKSLADDLGLRTAGTRGHPDMLHQAILAGLLAHVGSWDERKKEYAGARGARFAIFPGSSVAKSKPAMVMAGELVETSRLWGRDVAGVDPAWVEKQAAHLVHRSHADPHWSASKAAVVATERVTLFGVPLVTDRQVLFHHVDPLFARNEFIRRALVEGDWKTQHAFFAANRALLDDAEELQSRTRRRDLLVGDDELFDFYDSKIPEHVVTGRHFDTWWKKTRTAQPDLLSFTEQDVLSEVADELDTTDYPRVWRQGQLELPLTYQFDPGHDADGVTVHIDVAVLNQLEHSGFDWQIPGLRAELITGLLRALPKPLRRQLVPMPDLAAAVAGALPDQPSGRRLVDEITDIIYGLRGVRVEPDQWATDAIPDHLRVTFRVEKGTKILAEGKSLPELVAQTAGDVAAVVRTATQSVQTKGHTTFPADGIPQNLNDERSRTGGVAVTGYAGLVATGKTVAIEVFPHADIAAEKTRIAVRSLLIAQLPDYTGAAVRGLSKTDTLQLATSGYRNVAALRADVCAAAFDDVIARQPALPHTAEDFDQLAKVVSVEAPALVERGMKHTIAVLRAAGEARAALPKTSSLHVLASVSDVSDQVASLVSDGFIVRTGLSRLPDVVRYLQAAAFRCTKLHDNPGKDADQLRSFQAMQQQYDQIIAGLPKGRPLPQAAADAAWLLEEFRIHLFAQHIKTAKPISIQRLSKQFTALRTHLKQ